MLRHVNNRITNKYWIYNYRCIRKYYPENKILIIDDNSDYNFITNEKLYKTTIINSEYPKRGELLPYYYYLHNKLFDIAVIIHDSVFINSRIDTNVKNYKFLWEFEHDWDQIKDETRLINVFNDDKLKQFYDNKKLWKGCFGGMSIIKHDYLVLINNKYDLSKLLDCIKNRHNRRSFERVLGCMLQKNDNKETLLGNIHKYYPGEMQYLFLKDFIKYKKYFSKFPVIKIWTGR